MEIHFLAIWAAMDVSIETSMGQLRAIRKKMNEYEL
jgi:hypothetical protein